MLDAMIPNHFLDWLCIRVVRLVRYYSRLSRGEDFKVCLPDWKSDNQAGFGSHLLGI